MLRTVSARFTRTPLARRSITYDYRAISDGQKSTEHLRRPARGGQNLSERYVRLEKSLRQKGARSSELEQIQQQPSPSQAATQTSGALKPHQKPVQYFRGFQIPEEPRPPADDECCMSGCAVCVYDLYEESLDAYEKAVANLRSSLYAADVPEYEWPASIQTTSSPGDKARPSESEKRKDTVMSAFEEMERSLALKRQAEAEAEARGGSPRIIESRVLIDPTIAKLGKAKRNQVTQNMKEAPRETFFQQLYQGLRWVLFSSW